MDLNRSSDRPRLVADAVETGSTAGRASGQTRREFGAGLLGSVIAFGLVETLWARRLLADGEQQAVGRWFNELAELTNDLRGRQLKDTEFQARMEELYRRVDLAELIRAVRLDELEKQTRLPDNGAANVGFDLRQVAGVPAELKFGKQIFGLKKGRSIVPHGHSNMCTGFIVLTGRFRGRHYDRTETQTEHYLIRPTIDREFKPGELSTISDHKDNVHWFEALSDTGFIFNVHVVGYDPAIQEASGRLYLDPEGETVAGGLIRAKKLTSAECHRKYG
jgi:hypothetical protein